MPGTADPIGGVQGYTAQIQALQTRIQNLETWQRQASGVVQPGTITRWGGASAPTGALVCDGSTFDPAVYPQLAAALGSSTLPSISTSPITVIWTGPQSAI